MAKKISDLDLIVTPLDGTEYLEIVQSGVSKRITLDLFIDLINSRYNLSQLKQVDSSSSSSSCKSSSSSSSSSLSFSSSSASTSVFTYLDDTYWWADSGTWNEAENRWENNLLIALFPIGGWADGFFATDLEVTYTADNQTLAVNMASQTDMLYSDSLTSGVKVPLNRAAGVGVGYINFSPVSETEIHITDIKLYGYYA